MSEFSLISWPLIVLLLAICGMPFKLFKGLYWVCLIIAALASVLWFKSMFENMYEIRADVALGWSVVVNMALIPMLWAATYKKFDDVK